MVTAPAKRLLVRMLQDKGLSERRALRVAQMSASALRYAPRPDANAELREQIIALAQRHRRYGADMIYLKLRQAGQAGRSELDITAWLLWFLEQVELAARHSIATLSKVLAKARFWLRYADAPLNERQRKALNRLLDARAGEFENGETVRKYASATQTSPATASRELIQMEKLGCLVRTGKGRSTLYELPVVAYW